MGVMHYNSILHIDPQEFTTVSGDNDDVVLDSSQLWITCTDDNDALTGAIPPMSTSGSLLWVRNVSASNTLVVKNNDTGSTDGYRFILGGGSTTLTLEPGQGQQFSFISGTGWVPLRLGTYA